MLTQLNVAIFIVLIVSFSTYCEINEKDSKIKWTITNSPIVFGSDAVLFCNLSATDNCCTNAVTWMKESDVILHHGASTNSSKYQQIQENDGYSIVIKHFDEKDINCQYTCLYEFYSYSRVLHINLKDFELQPTHETFKSTIIASSSQLVVVLNFSKVFPSPQCQIGINERILPSKRFANETRSGIFLSSHVKLMCDLQFDICSGNVSIRCLIGRAVMIISEETIMSDCKDSDTLSTSTQSNTTEVATGVMAFIAICVVTFVLIIWRRNARSKSNRLGNVEDQDYQDERKPLLCTAEIISEISSVPPLSIIPAQKSTDVVLLLKAVCLHSKNICLTTTNTRINEKRVKSSTASKDNCFQHISHKGDNHCCSVRRYLNFKKNNDLREIIFFAYATDDKNWLLTATNNRINDVNLLSRRHQTIHDCSVGSLYSKNHNDPVETIVCANKRDVTNIIMTDGTPLTWRQLIYDYIRSKMLALRKAIWSLFYTSNSKINDEIKQHNTGTDGPPISRFNRIKHDIDLIIAIESYKKTNPCYCLLMACNIRINKARMKISKTKCQ